MKYDIVFEGGGAKGMVFVGALREFVARGHEFGRLLGTSAGAIMATFVAAGYTVEEMYAALGETDEAGKPVFTTFMQRPAPFDVQEVEESTTNAALQMIDVTALPGFMERRIDQLILGLMSRDPFVYFFSLLERGGWYSTDGFMTWLQTKLDQGRSFGRPARLSRMNFQEFHKATGSELTLVAADTTGHSLLVLNHVTAPLCPVMWAVRMSMSLPLVWEPVSWRAEWGPYLGQDLTNNLIVDGGLLSNFPIELFISRDPYVVTMMGKPSDNKVLGLLIDESLPVYGAELLSQEDFAEVGFTFPTQIRNLVDTATQAHDKMVISNYERLVCHLPAKGYGTTEFGMTAERREALIFSGRMAMADYYDNDKPEMAGFAESALEALSDSTDRVDALARKLLTP